jgi:hypothetical protein
MEHGRAVQAGLLTPFHRLYGEPILLENRPRPADIRPADAALRELGLLGRKGITQDCPPEPSGKSTTH